MPTIRFVKNLPAIEVDKGARLMEVLLTAGLPVASSCHGDGVCGKCRIRVLEGLENLSRVGPLEEILRERHRMPRDVRISCQTDVLGDIRIDATYW
ncbi:MAG: 2Fe-2S iron-sulfur cluster-binding protein [Bdellovibrionales bacterium]